MPRPTTAPACRARVRHCLSPPKVRQVLELIAGEDVDERARHAAALRPRRRQATSRKLLDSAVANAEHNDNIPEDELLRRRGRSPTRARR